MTPSRQRAGSGGMTRPSAFLDATSVRPGAPGVMSPVWGTQPGRYRDQPLIFWFVPSGQGQHVIWARLDGKLPPGRREGPGGVLSHRTEGDDAARNKPRNRRRGQSAGRRLRYSLGQRVAAWTSVAVVAVLVAGALVAYAKYRSYWDSIQRVDVAGLVGRQPPKLNNAENILLIGSDTRVGQRGIGGSSSSVA